MSAQSKIENRKSKIRSGLLAGGNWIIDYTKLIDSWPAQDTLANIVEERRSNGGGPYNILVDLAKMGAPFPLAGAGLVGDDPNGCLIIEDCARHGIDASLLRATPDAPTSYTDVMTVRSTGRRTFFHQRGANRILDAAHIDLASSRARIFYLGYILLLDRMDEPDTDHGTIGARVLREARALGFKTASDLVSADHERLPEIVAAALPHLDYLVLNELEAGRVTDLSTRHGDDLDAVAVAEAARKLLDGGVGEWVAIHFPEGAIAAHRDGAIHALGSVLIPQEKIAGAVGAGDAFAAGLLHGLHEGEPMETCLRQATCAAAMCLTDPTTSGGMRPLADCLALGEQHGFRAKPG